MKKLLYTPYTFNVILLMILLLISITVVPSIFSIFNLIIVLRQASIIGILAIGLTFVIITGGIDLSVGAIASLCAGICAGLLVYYHLPIPLAILLVSLLGIVCGVFNGFIITILKIRPVIATLGSMTLFSGIILSLSNGMPINGLPQDFIEISRKLIFGIPLVSLIWMILVALAAILLSLTFYGRYMYAIGDSQTAVEMMGINIVRYKLLAYALSGLFAGIAGILLLSRTTAVPQNENIQLVFDSIMAITIGGISLNGASGKLRGAFFGAITIVFLYNCLTFLDVNTYFQSTIKGLIFLTAVAYSEYRELKYA